MLYNNGVIVRRLNEGASLSKTKAQPGPMTDARIKAQHYLKNWATSSGMTLNQALTGLLTENKTFGLLGYYISAHHETAFSNPLKRAAQAALIRFQDVATISKALGISDEEALIEIENAEGEAIKTNNPDAGILPVDVQGMLAFVMDEFQNAANKNGLPSKSADLYGLMTNVIGDNFDSNQLGMLSGVSAILANNADSTTGYEDYSNPDGSGTSTDYSTTSSTGDGSATGTSGDTSGTTSGGWDWNSIFGTINNAVNTIKNATGAITGIAGATTSGINQVSGAASDLGGDIGANAINRSNLPWLIGGGVVLIIIVIIAVHYAGKNK